MFKLREAQLKADGAGPRERLRYYARMSVDGHLPDVPAVFLVFRCALEAAMEDYGMNLRGYGDSMLEVLDVPGVQPEWMIDVLRDMASYAEDGFNRWLELLANILEIMSAPFDSLTSEQLAAGPIVQEKYLQNRKEADQWLGAADRAAECWN